MPVKLVSFQRDIPVCVFPGGVSLTVVVRFLGLRHRVAERWNRVSGASSHRRKDHRERGLTWSLRGKALLKKCITSDKM